MPEIHETGKAPLHCLSSPRKPLFQGEAIPSDAQGFSWLCSGSLLAGWRLNVGRPCSEQTPSLWSTYPLTPGPLFEQADQMFLLLGFLRWSPLPCATFVGSIRKFSFYRMKPVYWLLPICYTGNSGCAGCHQLSYQTSPCTLLSDPFPSIPAVFWFCGF